MSSQSHSSSLTPQQQDALNDIKKRIEAISPQRKEILELYVSKFTLDATLLRYLRAREYNVEQAYNMLVECLEWRATFQGIGVKNITAHSIDNELKSGKAFYHGKDKEGRPLCCIKVKLHDQKLSDLEEVQRFCIYMMEKGSDLLTPPLERCSVIFDMSGFSLRNLDLKVVQFIIDMLEKYYPESLGVAVIVNSPWMFHGFWSVIKGWLPETTREKIKFASVKELTNFVNEDELLEAYGGKNTYQFSIKELC